MSAELSERENIEAHIGEHWYGVKQARLSGDETHEVFHTVNMNVWLETLTLYLGQTATEKVAA